VASDEDNSPTLRIWDLRNTISPFKEFVGHSRGVIAMSWCPSDSLYLLTCAKDNRTLCWDTGSGEIVCELPAGANWNFDVQWSPKIPGVLSTSSFDGKIGIYNIEACGRNVSGEAEFGGAIVSGGSSALLKAPKWLERPAGVSFGFGGQAVQGESGQSLGHMSPGIRKLSSFHPQSLPEYINGVINSLPYNPSAAVSEMTAVMVSRPNESIEDCQIFA
jgi:protein transport protein SEC31